MTLKILCFIFVFLSGTLIGMEFRKRLAVHLDALRMFRVILREMKAMVAYKSLPAGDMVMELCRRNIGQPFLQDVAQRMAEKSFHASWHDALIEFQKPYCLHDSDVEFLTECADHIGRYDVDSELSFFDLYDDRMSHIIEEAQNRLVSDGRLYVIIGCSCGIVAALVFI